jgi:hypothetical protein
MIRLSLDLRSTFVRPSFDLRSIFILRPTFHGNPMTIRKIPIALALLAMTLLALSGLGVRAGVWHFSTGFQLLTGAVVCGLAAVICALIGVAVPKWRTSVPTLLLAIAFGVGSAGFPLYMMQQAKKVPPIHDISTDLTDPPAFVAVLPLRFDAANPIIHGGTELATIRATMQRRAYPDIVPLMLADTFESGYARALAAAKRMQWDIVAADAQSGRIEATATTFWFGFKDDIVIRVTSIGGASRVDVRSVSRVGKSDVGANAARIRAYLASLASLASM